MTLGLLAGAALAGLLIGLSLGLLGGGGSILAVPVLLALGQTAGQATTGSLAVVAATSLVGAVAAQRVGSTVLVGGGVAFGGLAVGGAALGAHAAGAVPDAVLLLAFAALLLVVAGLMVRRQLRAGASGPAVGHRSHVGIDDPIITFTPAFACACPRAVKVLVTATLVGLLTGFLGVGGGFLVVPALVIALGLPMAAAVGTSLVAIAVTSLAALLVRLGATQQPDWHLVALLTGLAVAGALVGTWVARRVEAGRLQAAFTALLVVVAVWTAARGLPALA
ncbi:TSUP family transporter [Nocardioides sp. GXQ0305]|uniref:TSUP family transporter n=1 Tax=Nocardioides sp. GXQ0305 TaxID=3423912 RepID=UPI003D7E1AE5